MPPAVGWAIAIGVVALIALIIVITRRMERRRREALEQVAVGAGFAFQPRVAVQELASLGEIQLYSRGHSRRAANVMAGRLDDDEVRVFDYRYTTGSGRNQHTTEQTVVVFPRAAPALPDLQLAPENIFHKIGQAFGFQDIDFDFAPEFSKRYLVRGRDETAIRAALRPETLSFLTGQLGWTVETQSGTVGVYRASRRAKPEDVRAFIEEAREVMRNLRRP